MIGFSVSKSNGYFSVVCDVCTVFELSQKWDSLKGSVLQADTSFGACSKTVETAFKLDSLWHHSLLRSV